MPQLTNVVLKDSANADHTFIPENVSGNVATLVESTGVPIGDKRLSIGQTRTAQGRRKVTVKLAIPTVQDAVVNGVSRPTVVRSAYADVVLSFDAGSTTLERKSVLTHLGSLMANALFVSAAGDLQGIY